jgi:hypothetical protein
MNLCPTCGHPIRDWLHLRSVPLPGEDFPVLKRHQKTIFETVKRAGDNGIPAGRLFDILYGADPNGGPDFNTLSAIISHLNRKLKPHGVKVFAGRGSAGVYRLVKTGAPP